MYQRGLPEGGICYVFRDVCLYWFELQYKALIHIWIYPDGVLRRRLLYQNGNFVPPAQWVRSHRHVKVDFRRKMGCSRPFMHQSGWFQGVKRPKLWWHCSRFRAQMGHFWYLTKKEGCTGRAELSNSGPFGGSPDRNTLWETAEKCQRANAPARPFMHAGIRKTPLG